MNHEALSPPNTLPGCTYRLQLQKEFGFKEARELVGYLAELGISHCYTSPFFKARPGSSHGYDVVDPNDFNPEIGDAEAFAAFVAELRKSGLSLLIDLVPNHMGVMGGDNLWWLDVLENGPASVYARFFDIDWQPFKKSLRNRILVPVLGDHYGRELEAGRLHLYFEERTGSFTVRYYDHLFPIDPRTYPIILRHNLTGFSEETGRDHPDFLALQDILELCLIMPGRTATSADKKQRRRSTGLRIKEKLVQLAQSSQAFADHLRKTIEKLNGIQGQRRSFIALHQLLERQAFRLSYWKVAADEINYRRFFDINDLAGLRVERDDVFEETHRLLFRLVEQGAIAGLRIDHIDGLYDPAGYLRRLQEKLDSLQPERQLYLVVEKILGHGEKLPTDSATHGTTGYEFGALVNGILLDGNAAGRMSRVYTNTTGLGADFEPVLRDCKKHILQDSLASELNTLANLLARLSEADWQSRDFTFNSLRRALIEIVASFPVYRTYVVGRRISESDRRAIGTAVESAKSVNPERMHTLLDFIAELLLQQRGWLFRRTDRKAVQDFCMRLQQLTAPATAKGLEDTALYRFNRLVSENEVGFHPGHFGLLLHDFHQANRERLINWPHNMLATSTHDTKRSEDVRARLDVLSEMTAEWQATVRTWRRSVRGYRTNLKGRTVPDANEEYMLYQNLLGIWPLQEPDNDSRRLLQQRFAAFALKAAREAKQNTSWRNPDEKYEKALESFIFRLFADSASPFWHDFLNLHRRLAPCGLYNSLSQVLLKMTVPGVPDIYQGCELWNFSLVDPDNRRPVDFRLRQQMLQELQTLEAGGELPARELEKMMSDLTDGRIKMYVIWRCLQLRRSLPDLFSQGEYLPLAAVGEHRHHICAFLRRFQDRTLLTLAPRLFWTMIGGDPDVRPLAEVWGDTALELPEEYSSVLFHCRFSGRRLMPQKDGDRCYLPVGEILKMMPVGLLVRS